MGAVTLLPPAAGDYPLLRAALRLRRHKCTLSARYLNAHRIRACSIRGRPGRRKFWHAKCVTAGSLQDIFEDMAAGRLSSDEYPYVRQPSASTASSFGESVLWIMERWGCWC